MYAKCPTFTKESWKRCKIILFLNLKEPCYNILICFLMHKSTFKLWEKKYSFSMVEKQQRRNETNKKPRWRWLWVKTIKTDYEVHQLEKIGHFFPRWLMLSETYSSSIKFETSSMELCNTNLKIFDIKHIFKDNDPFVFFPCVSIHPV